MAADPKKPFHERIAEQLIEQLKEGRAPWQKPWEAGESYLPHNAVTGNRYKGVNAVALMMAGRDDQRWLTYKQAEAIGAQVKKGERGTGIIYWKFDDEKPLKDESGRPIRDAEGKVLTAKVRLERPTPFYATVFNAEQVEGMPPVERREPQPFDKKERVEQIMANSGVKITEAPGDRAYYSPGTDSIRLPDRGQFSNEAGFYATALHELGHATGHVTRLDRDLSGGFGSERYAREELRAEISSMLVGDELGLGHDPGQHVAYVQSWIKVLTDTPLEIMRACSDAERIREHVLGWEQAQSLAIEPEIDARAIERTAIIDELTQLSAQANAGYDPLASWQNLEATAERLGLVATIARGDDSGDKVVIPPYQITYATAEGEPTSITTELYSDGKALTMAQGSRVPGTGFTSDTDWQSAALATAKEIEATVAAERTAEIENDAYSVMMTAAASAESAGEIGASEGQCRTIAKAIAKGEITSPGLFGSTTLPPSLSSDAAASAIAAINRLPKPGLDNNVPAPTAAPAASQVIYLTAYEAAYAEGYEQTGQGKEANDYAESFAATHAGDDLQSTAPIVRSTFSEDTWAIIANRSTGGERDVKAAPAVVDQFMEERSRDPSAQDVASGRIDINAPYEDRKEVRALGGEWDKDKKTWFVPAGVNPAPFAKWGVDEATNTTAGDPKASKPGADERAAVMQARAAEGRTYIDVPFPAKAEAKRLGAKWDAQAGSWYAPTGDVSGLAARFPRADAGATTATAPAATAQPERANAPDAPTPARAGSAAKTYLAVPFREKAEAQALGARWDKAAKSWYAPEGADARLTGRFGLDKADRQERAKDPRDEFADVLRGIGADLSGGHPYMDGQRHRIPSNSDKAGEKSVMYVGHLDGHPAGYYDNHRGQSGNWKSTGYTLTDDERAALKAEAATKLQERNDARDRSAEATAARCAGAIERAVPVASDGLTTTYLERKGIEPRAGVFTNAQRSDTIVPAIDIAGKHWTNQTIDAGGVKRFASEGRKEGCFHVVGAERGAEIAALDSANVIVIAEGYATAATIDAAIEGSVPGAKPATVAAFDSGNIMPVALALRERYPEAAIVVAGDDDYRLESKRPFINVGKVSAHEAADAVRGVAIVPALSTDDRAFAFTDFDDIGKDAARRQLAPAITTALSKITPVARIGRDLDSERVAIDEKKRRSIDDEPQAQRRSARI